MPDISAPVVSSERACVASTAESANAVLLDMISSPDTGPS
jgi:hypothetical protein